MFLCVEVVSTIPFASSQSQMKSELAAVASEFGRLTRFLAEEQAGLERRLREMHEAQLGRAGAAASRLAEQAAQLSRLLAEAQERSQQGGLRLLQVSSAPFLISLSPQNPVLALSGNAYQTSVQSCLSSH